MRAPRTRPRARGDGLGIKRLFSQGLASHRGLWSTPACGSPDSGPTLEPEVDDGVEDDDGPRSSSRAHLARRILHGSRVFSGVDTSVDIVPLPLNRILVRPPSLLSLPLLYPADNEKSRVRMVVTQSAPVAASAAAIRTIKLFV